MLFLLNLFFRYLTFSLPSLLLLSSLEVNRSRCCPLNPWGSRTHYRITSQGRRPDQSRKFLSPLFAYQLHIKLTLQLLARLFVRCLFSNQCLHMSLNEQDWLDKGTPLLILGALCFIPGNSRPPRLWSNESIVVISPYYLVFSL